MTTMYNIRVILAKCTIAFAVLCTPICQIIGFIIGIRACREWDDVNDREAMVTLYARVKTARFCSMCAKFYRVRLEDVDEGSKVFLDSLDEVSKMC